MRLIRSIFTIALHSLVNFNLQIPSHAAYFGVILGLAWSLDLRSRRTAGKGGGV